MTIYSYLSFIVVVLCLNIGTAYAACFLANQKLTLRFYWMTVLAFLPTMVLKAFFIVPAGLIMLCCVLAELVLTILLNRAKPGQIIVLALKFFLILFSQELLAALLLSFLPNEMIPQTQSIVYPLTYLLFNLTFTPLVLLIVWAIRLARSIVKLIRYSGDKRKGILGVYLRMGVLVLATLANLYLIIQYVDLAGIELEIKLYIVALPAAILLVAVTLVYFIRDLNLVRQLRRNETLEYQQAISDALLKRLRYFKHNLVNMLYGFEGTLLSGDVSEVRDYYDHIVSRCALINNENVMAIQRIQSSVLGATLLRKVDAAQEKEIPVYITTSDSFVLGNELSEAELAEVLGVLMDNSIEAAAQASAPYISLNIRNDGKHTEIVMKNSFGESLPRGPFSPVKSSKDGHDGLGIASCHAVLRKHASALLNLSVEGQYFVAQVYY